MRAARWAAVALLAAGLGAIGSSCTAALGLDDYEDATDALCDTLDHCFLEWSKDHCQDHVRGGLGTPSADARSQWLRRFADRSCLESCTAARRCLDLPPVCVDGACTIKDDCCDFAAGKADCARGQCCKRRGVECESNADCCPGEGLCEPAGSTRTCGGTVCREGGEACDNNLQCCSGRCKDRQCSKTICDEVGFECTSAADCCSGFCDDEGRCNLAGCAVEGGSCLVDDDCCSEAPFCVTGACSPRSDCVPANVDCLIGDQCCSGHCDTTYFVCGETCQPEGSPCSNDGECCANLCQQGVCAMVCSTSYCEVDADCCSNNCVKGTCAEACKPSQCEHDVCNAGGPLDPAACGNLPASCVQAVCDLDTYCCCGGWDTLCVKEALQLQACTGLCPP